MPRVANPPNMGHRRDSSKQSKQNNSTPHKSMPMKIPLNDDAGEKVARLQSRQALHDMQMNQIKAAVKTPMPMRKINNYDRASSTSPRTPRGSGARGSGARDNNDPDGVGRAVTPMKRVPILANFEEWMKMATDNKINANNSWNFALIDYFHDMSLLREGDSVNFQKASCTLDGCVKIYTSRVDSVATETGKLLSGLAESRENKRRREQGEGGEGEEDAEDEEELEDGTRRKVRKKANRTHESTLAPSFASLQLKKFELEFAVDPLFKKASADFDEGGAKGLLLNHLAIDAKGRIVFDSSDNAEDATAEGDDAQDNDDREQTAETERTKSPTPRPRTADSSESHTELDLSLLARQHFSNIERLGDQDLCPSLKGLDLGDPSGSLDIPFLRAPEDWRQDRPMESEEQGQPRDASGIMLDDDMAIGFDDDDATITGFDLGGDAGFGEGGEAWAREAALEPMLNVHRVDDGDGNNDGSGMAFDSTEDDPYAITLSHQPANREHENILSYFDNALKKDWAGPEHWKIRRVRETAASATSNAPKQQRKEKEKFEIDFASPLDPSLAEMIYTPASSNSAISLPKTQWKTKGRNLLPDDKHFNSRQLLQLFLKPKARMGFRSLSNNRRQSGRAQHNLSSSNNGEMDEAFWASHKPDMDQTEADERAANGAYDADFFADEEGLAFPNGMPIGGADDDDDNLPFADAREAFSPSVDPNAPPSTSAGDNGGASGLTALLKGAATPGGGLAGGFGSQLVTQGGRRVRPDYVAYARVAKKVDVRLLKEEMWKGMGDNLIASSNFSSSASPEAPAADSTSASDPSASNGEDPDPTTATPEQQPPPSSSPEDDQLRFTQVMTGLKTSYPEPAMKDISTSYCFICLLHLANEKGLVLNNQDGEEGDWDGRLDEVFITKDAGAVIEGEA